MVHRLVVQYGQPTDPAEFDRHYRDVHVGLAQAIPGLQRVTAAEVQQAAQRSLQPGKAWTLKVVP